MTKLSLRARLFLLTTVALAPGIFILSFNIASLRQSREAEVHATAYQIGNLAMLEMQRIVAGVEGLLNAIARAPIIRNFETPACESYLADIKLQNIQLNAIAVIDASGLLRCRSPMLPGEQRYDDRSYFHEAMEQKHFIVGEYTISKNNKQPFLPVAVPIFGAQGDVAGVLVGGLRLVWLRDEMRRRPYAKNEALSIADRNGVLLAREPFSERFVGTKIPPEFQPLVQAATSGTTEVTSQDGTRRILGYFPPASNTAGLYVSAGIAREDAFAPINEATQRGVLLILAGAAIAYLVAMRMGRSLIRAPVIRLSKTINAWRNGDDRARTGMARAEGELEGVGFEIDRFMDELVEGRAARVKAEENRELLLREMEHRVKNILTTVQVIAGQTLKKDAVPQATVDNFLGRLQAMGAAHRLLLADDWQATDIETIINAAVETFDRAPSVFSKKGPNLSINAKAAWALSLAIHELCTNAVKYGALREDNGSISIDWAIANAGNEEMFTLRWVERDGPPVKAPKASGFGSKLINRVLSAELGGNVAVSFPSEGLTCDVSAPARNVVEER